MDESILCPNIIVSIMSKYSFFRWANIIVLCPNIIVRMVQIVIVEVWVIFFDGHRIMSKYHCKYQTSIRIFLSILI